MYRIILESHLGLNAWKIPRKIIKRIYQQEKKNNMTFPLQRAGAEKNPHGWHMERYPMSSSDLLSSNSSSENDMRDLIYRNYQLNHSFERFYQMANARNDLTAHRSHDNKNRPHSMFTPKCTKIRTNPKYRYSYSNCHSKVCNRQRFPTFNCENSDNSSDSQCSPIQQRQSQRNRRRHKLRANAR